MQLNHYNTKFIKRKFPIILVCDQVTNAANLGSLFRIADAFGIEKLILCGENISLSRKLMKASRAAEKYVDFEIKDSATCVIDVLKATNHQIISLEITQSSQSIQQFKFNIEKPIALLVGDENFGISEDLLKNSDTIIHIEMYGNNSSMNVAQATNIALYEITKQFMIPTDLK